MRIDQSNTLLDLARIMIKCYAMPACCRRRERWRGGR